MRFAFLRALFAAALCGVAFISCCRADDAVPAQPQPTDVAAQLVRRALLAETQGKADERLALLKQAEQVAPDFAPARWQLGDLQIDGNWTHYDAAANDPQRTAKLEEYRQKRDQASLKSYDDQMALARWCEKAGLKQQQQLHLMAALGIRPKSSEAKGKLGLVYHNGKWIPPAEIEASDEQLKAQQQEGLKWKDHLVKLRGQLENKETAAQALQDLQAIGDPAAIPALETVFGRAKPDVAKAVIAALGNMHYQSATESLVRFAVLSSNADVRYAAGQALKTRSMYSYVPLLIADLDSPISVQFEKFQLPNGALGYQMSMFKEKPSGDKMYISRGFMDPTWHPLGYLNLQRGYDFRTGISPPVLTANPAAIADVSRAADRAEQRANRAMEANSRIAANNDRVFDVLKATTGQDFGTDPIAWNNWWNDYNEFVLAEKEPTDYGFDSTYSSPYKPTYSGNTLDLQPRRGLSCFAAGTSVWTISGAVPVDKIKQGDLVLSQNADTSELAYKTVLATTVRPPSDILDVHLADASIRCTRGHPFWVSGAGWKMAKELKAGDWLHTVRGPVLIDSVDKEKDTATGYNLIVADFGSYFVGEAMVLVHDNNLRQPTEAVVPGLIPR